MLKPEIAILVNDGIVQAVVTTKKELQYRIIDIDAVEFGDYEADSVETDIDQYTREEMGIEKGEKLEDLRK